jgi:hypothetical protein
VDFLHLLCSNKPALRVMTRSADTDVRGQVERWAMQHDLGAASDMSFTWVASSDAVAARLLEIDVSTTAHEVELGRALGYPACCIASIASVGEAEIDECADAIRQWRFAGTFAMIDPHGYEEGRALISHLPCRPDCLASLRLAQRAARWVRASEPRDVEPWRTWRQAVEQRVAAVHQ